MTAAQRRLDEIEAALRTRGLSPRTMMLNQVVPEPFRHYPEGDLYDRQSRSQAYFHIHDDGAAGHLHLFLRRGGIAADMRPVVGPIDSPTHLGAVELAADGWPQAVFATNRWVTGEAWYKAADIAQLLPLFRLELAEPWQGVGLWLTLFMTVHQDRFAALVGQRDAAVATWSDPACFEDTGREVLARLELA